MQSVNSLTLLFVVLVTFVVVATIRLSGNYGFRLILDSKRQLMCRVSILLPSSPLIVSFEVPIGGHHQGCIV
jgi:hypothetical protein